MNAPATVPIICATFAKNRSEVVVVALDEWKGRQLLDVRAHYQDGDLSRPTKKGLSLSLGKIDPLISALQQARAEAVRLGLLDGGPE